MKKLFQFIMVAFLVFVLIRLSFDYPKFAGIMCTIGFISAGLFAYYVMTSLDD